MEPVANTGWQPLEESVDSRTDVISQVGKTDLPYYCDCRTLPALLQLGAVPGRPVQPLFECQPTPVVISHARRREGSLRRALRIPQEVRRSPGSDTAGWTDHSQRQELWYIYPTAKVPRLAPLPAFWRNVAQLV